MTTPYDSRQDTRDHIQQVRELLGQVVLNLHDRMLFHDESKLKFPEKEAFDTLTPRLKSLTYGSDEYRACLKEMKPAIEHHYAENSHHPEHYPGGVDDMDLLDVIEMLADWKAASLRHADGDILGSLEINRERFKLSDQLYRILTNTIERMEWTRGPTAIDVHRS